METITPEEPPLKKSKTVEEEVVENPSSSVASSSSSPATSATKQPNGKVEKEDAHPSNCDVEEDVTEIPNMSRKSGAEKKNEDTTQSPDSSEDQNKKKPVNGQERGENFQKRDRGDSVDLSKVMERIKACEDRIDHITAEANTQVLMIERRLRDLKKPIFYERSRLVKFIPEFWLTTLINHPQISTRITELDEECLRYLKSLEVEEFDETRSGFKIDFHFSPNQYFENGIITKEVYYSSQGGLRSRSSQIRWKPQKNLVRIQASYRGNGSMPSQPSFFSWFLDYNNPGLDEIAEIIREDIWPNPLKYFQACSDQQAIELSSDGIVLDSSGDEIDDSVLVLGDEDEEELDEEEEDDDEDILLLENENNEELEVDEEEYIEEVDEEEEELGDEELGDEEDELEDEEDELGEEEEVDFDEEDEDPELLEESSQSAVTSVSHGKAKKSDKFVAKKPKQSDSESVSQALGISASATTKGEAKAGKSEGLEGESPNTGKGDDVKEEDGKT